MRKVLHVRANKQNLLTFHFFNQLTLLSFFYAVQDLNILKLINQRKNQQNPTQIKPTLISLPKRYL